MSGAAFAQTGPRIIDTGRLDQPTGTALPRGDVASPRAGTLAAPPGSAARHLVLRSIHVQGASAVPPQVLQQTWQRFIGRDISVQDVYAIADAISAAYADAGLSLFQVSVPPQSFADGDVRIAVVEGHVGAVVIRGDVKDADFSLLEAYAARIVADWPLHQATLEREILLMNRIAGLKVGSRFEALPSSPGAARLVLTVQRTRAEGLAGINNQGVNVLSRVEWYAGAGVNSLLQEGDRTELIFGAPIGLSRYQYYGITHIAPIGDNGATLTVNAGNLITHPQGDSLSGDAVVAGLTFSDPIILRLHESLVATGAFDFLDSNDALLGTTVSDERTRAFRAGLSYVRLDDWKGIDAAAVTISQGVDLFGARRGGLAYGGPDFTKVNLSLGRAQPLPWDLVVRVRAAAQYAFSHLPASEEFIFGTTAYGQAFAANPLYGDRGVEAYAELARGLPWLNLPKYVTGTELFAFTDWGEIWNTQTLFQVATDRAASVGVGIRVKLMDKLVAQFAAANAVVQPDSVPQAGRWSAIFTVVGSF